MKLPRYMRARIVPAGSLTSLELEITVAWWGWGILLFQAIPWQAHPWHKQPGLFLLLLRVWARRLWQD
jgi:hypothetical protein